MSQIKIMLFAPLSSDRRGFRRYESVLFITIVVIIINIKFSPT